MWKRNLKLKRKNGHTRPGETDRGTIVTLSLSLSLPVTGATGQQMIFSPSLSLFKALFSLALNPDTGFYDCPFLSHESTFTHWLTRVQLATWTFGFTDTQWLSPLSSLFHWPLIPRPFVSVWCRVKVKVASVVFILGRNWQIRRGKG